MVTRSGSGSIRTQARFYGFMGNVSVLCSHDFHVIHNLTSVAGAGKSVLSYVHLSMLCFWKPIKCHHLAPRSSRIFAARVH
jgi:hypothetical protein